MQKALKIGLIALVLGCGVQNASAFWRCGGGCGWGGGCCWSSCCNYCPAPCYPCCNVCPVTCPVPPAGGAAPAAPKTSMYRPATNSVLLTVNVPADAKVFVNGNPTTSTGARREYTSSNLQPAASYAYRVRAEFVRDGKPVSEEQIVQVSAGQIGSFEFKGSAGAQVAKLTSAGAR